MRHLTRIFGLVLFVSSFSHSAFSQCNPQNVKESIINGDFESGYVASGAGSFTSSQTWLYDPSNSAMSSLVDNIKATPANPANGCAWTSAGHFEIDSYFGSFTCSGGSYDGHPFITEGNGRYDHTRGIGQSGKYLMIDGQNGVSADPLGWKLWEQTLNVYSNEFYYFSAWFINLTPISTGADRADLRFIVQPYDASNNPIGGAVQLGATTWSPAEASRGNNWEQYYETYTTPINAVTMKLSIYNQTSVVNGNDIGIDDISFINGCSSILSLSTPPTPNLGSSQNLCETNGTITLNSSVATNAGAGRTFSWFSGTGTTQTQIGTTNTTSNTLAITTPGTYRVCVYQAGGCAKSSSITVTSTASATGLDINYCQDKQLAATITTTAVEPFLSYVWTKNGSAWAGSVNSKNATADGAGTFLLTGTHSNGIAACNVSKSFTVIANSAILSSAIGPGPYTLCSPASQTLTSSLTGTGYGYTWYRNGVMTAGNTSSYSANSAGNYYVEINLNRTGCGNVVSNTVVVNSSNAITPANGAFCPNSTVNLSVTPTLASVYRWYDSDNTTIVQNPSAGSSSFTTPVLTGNKTYYVEDSRVSATTLTTAALGGSNWGTPQESFDLTNAIVLKSVDVQRSGAWQGAMNLTVQIYNSSNTLLGTSSSAVEADGSPALLWTLTFTPTVSLPAGTGYYLRISAGSTSGGMATWNHPSGSGVTNATSSSGPNIFANWAIDVPTNTCARVPVNALANCTLPLNFLLFTGDKSNSGNFLKWTTSHEINVSHFEIEKSYDGIHFIKITSIPAAGKISLNSYEYLDMSINGELVYYRIKEMDNDGYYAYSTVISIDDVDVNGVQISENFFSDFTPLKTLGNEEDEYLIRVLDMRGKIIYEKVINGLSIMNLGHEWISGLYIVHAESNGESWSYKIVKK